MLSLTVCHVSFFQDFMPPVCFPRVMRAIEEGGAPAEEEEQAGAEEEEEAEGEAEGEGEAEEEGEGEEEEAEQEEEEEEENGGNGETEQNEEGAEEGEHEVQEQPHHTEEENSKGMRQKGTLIYRYNEPVVFPEKVTKRPPTDFGRRNEENERHRNLNSNVEINRASDVARSRKNGDKDDGSHAIHLQASSVLVLAAILVRFLGDLL